MERISGDGAGPVRRNRSAPNSTAMPSRWSVSANPPSPGVRTMPSAATASHRTASGTSPLPDSQTRSCSATDRPRHVTRRTSRSACQPIVPATGSSRSVPSTATCIGARCPRNDRSTRTAASAPQPAPSTSTPHSASPSAAIGRPAAIRGAPTSRATRCSGCRSAAVSSGPGPRSACGAEAAAAASSPSPVTIAPPTSTEDDQRSVPANTRPAQNAAAAAGRRRSLTR